MTRATLILRLFARREKSEMESSFLIIWENCHPQRCSVSFMARNELHVFFFLSIIQNISQRTKVRIILRKYLSSQLSRYCSRTILQLLQLIKSKSQSKCQKLFLEKYLGFQHLKCSFISWRLHDKCETVLHLFFNISFYIPVFLLDKKKSVKKCFSRIFKTDFFISLIFSHFPCCCPAPDRDET